MDEFIAAFSFVIIVFRKAQTFQDGFIHVEDFMGIDVVHEDRCGRFIIGFDVEGQTVSNENGPSFISGFFFIELPAQYPEEFVRISCFRP